MLEVYIIQVLDVRSVDNRGLDVKGTDNWGQGCKKCK